MAQPPALAESLAAASVPRRSGLLSAVWRFARRKPLGAFGAVVILLLLFTAVFPQVFTSQDPTAFKGIERLKSPSSAHPLGTDQFGRDQLSRLVHGARTSVSVSFGAITISVVLATLIGTISGYFGGWVDAVMQRFVDAAIAFPNLIVLITLVAVLGAGLYQIVLALGIVSCFGTSRIVRSAVIMTMANPYIEAARVVGAHPIRIMTRHILPNVAPVVIISATVSMGGLVLAESGLSFLGFGIPPPTPSWGSMLGVDGRAYMERAPWLAVVPGIAIGSIVFAFNMLGDALRDTLDPRLRR
ncbi:MAG: ABC transporter permease [Dehalococcoidia bacterium]|nr:ABC transporter permease [Dehalococcoidia bacterium]